MFPVVLVLVGMTLAVITQCAVAAQAFTHSIGQGLACVFVPLYAARYAHRHPISPALLHSWYAGLVLLAFGIIVW